jgi:threonylcarbamoyladenosine tRNA methylthiotransferase MtaB
MRRRWSSRQIIDRCRVAAEWLDQPAFTTDVIVGFPGETENEFVETLYALREIGFSKIHVFPYSPRRGTAAAQMSDQISKDVKSERVKRVMALEAELRTRYFQSLVGRQLRVLVENCNPQDQTVCGTSCRYSPVTARAPYSNAQEIEGRLLTVVATGVQERQIVGRVSG